MFGFNKNSSIATCPICGGKKFKEYNSRPNAICVSCRSLERTRFQFLVLKYLGLPKSGGSVLHVAPEKALYDFFSKSDANKYHPCDIDPENKRYATLGLMHKIDLCSDLYKIPDASFDLIVHNHVLEHIPCAVGPVLKEHVRILRPEGYFIFSVPFREAESTDECLDMNLALEERIRRFGQADHMRIFGKCDFIQLLHSIFGEHCQKFDPQMLGTKNELEQYGIPYEQVLGISGSTVFVYKKPSVNLFKQWFSLGK
ncbi:class I SAM-dependent methyltransferase [Oxalicibacterium flavum]|uniref:class I SAM-dependent methyltransferase n=1 Tax=Oxalicibacterium flavum TaxID=179467 RepID=UPI00166E0A60|nr:class I SAM-dependent methyltransferase [Oxalicibacterium flavum]